jgi:hypothetical protein
VLDIAQAKFLHNIYAAPVQLFSLCLVAKTSFWTFQVLDRGNIQLDYVNSISNMLLLLRCKVLQGRCDFQNVRPSVASLLGDIGAEQWADAGPRVFVNFSPRLGLSG